MRAQFQGHASGSSFPRLFARTLPPAAAPIYFRDILGGLIGWARGEKALAWLEEDLRDYFGARHCFLASSGKAALTLILLALKDQYPERDEVLVPAFNCYSVPSAIVRAGLKVSLCDIDPETLDFDFDQLADKLKNPKLLCVWPTHLFGLPADVEKVREMKGQASLPMIVEDAAQAMGGESQGQKLGTCGDVGFFSLGRGKAFSTVEGGIILTDCDDLAGRIASKLENLDVYQGREVFVLFLYALALMILQRPSWFWLPKSLPFLKLGETVYDPNFEMKKMSGFQAGLAKEWREKLKRFQANRRSATQKWITDLPQGIQVPRPGALPSSLIRFPLWIKDHNKVQELLKGSTRKGLGISQTYPDSVDQIKELKGSFEGQDFPNARDAARQTITLPVHGYLKPRDRRKITTLIGQV